MSRLSERPHRTARMSRTRRRLEYAMADDHGREGQGRVGAERVRSLVEIT
jgi:hypothetical protein